MGSRVPHGPTDDPRPFGFESFITDLARGYPDTVAPSLAREATRFLTIASRFGYADGGPVPSVAVHAALRVLATRPLLEARILAAIYKSGGSSADAVLPTSRAAQLTPQEETRYARTLRHYAHLFGEAPPTSIWEPVHAEATALPGAAAAAAASPTASTAAAARSTARPPAAMATATALEAALPAGTSSADATPSPSLTLDRIAASAAARQLGRAQQAARRNPNHREALSPATATPGSRLPRLEGRPTDGDRRAAGDTEARYPKLSGPTARDGAAAGTAPASDDDCNPVSAAALGAAAPAAALDAPLAAASDASGTSCGSVASPWGTGQQLVMQVPALGASTDPSGVAASDPGIRPASVPAAAGDAENRGGAGASATPAAATSTSTAATGVDAGVVIAPLSQLSAWGPSAWAWPSSQPHWSATPAAAVTPSARGLGAQVQLLQQVPAQAVLAQLSSPKVQQRSPKQQAQPSPAPPFGSVVTAAPLAPLMQLPYWIPTVPLTGLPPRVKGAGSIVDASIHPMARFPHEVAAAARGGAAFPAGAMSFLGVAPHAAAPPAGTTGQQRLPAQLSMAPFPPTMLAPGIPMQPPGTILPRRRSGLPPPPCVTVLLNCNFAVTCDGVAAGKIQGSATTRIWEHRIATAAEISEQAARDEAAANSSTAGPSRSFSGIRRATNGAAAAGTAGSSATDTPRVSTRKAPRRAAASATGTGSEYDDDDDYYDDGDEDGGAGSGGGVVQRTSQRRRGLRTQPAYVTAATAAADSEYFSSSISHDDAAANASGGNEGLWTPPSAAGVAVGSPSRLLRANTLDDATAAAGSDKHDFPAPAHDTTGLDDGSGDFSLGAVAVASPPQSSSAADASARGGGGDAARHLQPPWGAEGVTSWGGIQWAPKGMLLSSTAGDDEETMLEGGETVDDHIRRRRVPSEGSPTATPTTTAAVMFPAHTHAPPSASAAPQPRPFVAPLRIGAEPSLGALPAQSPFLMSLTTRTASTGGGLPRFFAAVDDFVDVTGGAGDLAAALYVHNRWGDSSGGGGDDDDGDIALTFRQQQQRPQQQPHVERARLEQDLHAPQDLGDASFTVGRVVGRVDDHTTAWEDPYLATAPPHDPPPPLLQPAALQPLQGADSEDGGDGIGSAHELDGIDSDGESDIHVDASTRGGFTPLL